MKKWIYRILLGTAVIFAAVGLHMSAIVVGSCAMLGMLFYYLKMAY